VADTLRERGLIHSKKPAVLRYRILQWTGIAAMLLLTFSAGIHYGRNTVSSTAPVIQKIQQTTPVNPSNQTVPATREYVADLNPTFQEYRDEPDRPENGGRLFGKYHMTWISLKLPD